MKPIQKFYESYDYTNLSLIQNQSLKHLRNLSEIYKKKPIISLFKQKILKPIKNRHLSIFEEKKQKDDNKILQKKLMNIFHKPPKPIINSDFIQYEENSNKRNLFLKKSNKEKILKENNGLFMRLVKLKPFFNAKENDKNFNIEHSRNLKRIKKITLGKLRTDNFRRNLKNKLLLKKNNSENSIILPTLKKNILLLTVKKNKSCINLKSNDNINNNIKNEVKEDNKNKENQNNNKNNENQNNNKNNENQNNNKNNENQNNNKNNENQNNNKNDELFTTAVKNV